jgi:hypothetical protein
MQWILLMIALEHDSGTGRCRHCETGADVALYHDEEPLVSTGAHVLNDWAMFSVSLLGASLTQTAEQNITPMLAKAGKSTGTRMMTESLFGSTCRVTGSIHPGRAENSFGSTDQA